jgi:hypothetical protein
MVSCNSIRLVLLSLALMVGCSSKPRSELEQAEANLDEINRRIREKGPKDRPTLALLEEAKRWYGQEPDLNWVQCLECAEQLSKDGHATDPHEVLRGSIEVMQRLNVPPDGGQRIGEFCLLYAMRRRDSITKYDAAKPGPHPSTHQEALDILVEQKKF